MFRWISGYLMFEDIFQLDFMHRFHYRICQYALMLVLCVIYNFQFVTWTIFWSLIDLMNFFFVFWIKRLVCRQWEANICPLLLTIFGLKKWQDLCWILTCCYGNFLLNDKFVVYWIILGFLWAKTRHGKYDISTDNLYVTYI